MSGSYCDDNGGIFAARASGGSGLGHTSTVISTLTSSGTFSGMNNGTETSIGTSWAGFLSATENVAFHSWGK